MVHYEGACHCGAVSFEFESEAIEKGVRCNCSLCKRKGVIMSPFSMLPECLKVTAEDEVIGRYQFGTHVAKHYFCKQCGIYTFHETRSMPGQLRVNLGCIDAINSTDLPFEVLNGAALALDLPG